MELSTSAMSELFESLSDAAKAELLDFAQFLAARERAEEQKNSSSEFNSRLGRGGNRLPDMMTRDIIDSSRAVMGDNLLAIVLYGSYARGDQDEESDVDIALIVRQELSRDEERRMAHYYSELCLKYDMVFSPNDIVQQKFEEWKNVLPYYRNIVKDGIVLWKTQAA